VAGRPWACLCGNLSPSPMAWEAEGRDIGGGRQVGRRDAPGGNGLGRRGDVMGVATCGIKRDASAADGRRRRLGIDSRAPCCSNARTRRGQNMAHARDIRRSNATNALRGNRWPRAALAYSRAKRGVAWHLEPPHTLAA